MNSTDIEWVRNPDGTPGYSWNPITGCLNHKNGLCLAGGFPCYAYRTANGRVRNIYLANKNWDTRTPAGYPGYPSEEPFYPRYWHNRIESHIAHENSPERGIFVCDMSDLFGISVRYQWTINILTTIKCNPQNRYYLLTKQPQNLLKFSPFPDNAWVGVTYTGGNGFTKVLAGLKEIEAKIKYLSIEPLLIKVPELALNTAVKIVNQIILGACTGTRKEIEALVQKYPELTPMQWGKKWTAQPPIEWLKEIVQAADQAGVKVFLKDNLRPLLESPSSPSWARGYFWRDGYYTDEDHPDIDLRLRQELPE